MRIRSITRLRLGFLTLGAALLLPLFLLLLTVEQRLEAQRKLRHEVVAERIFDELERELTALLDRESARSSADYDAGDTQASSWAPFVLGYFVQSAAPGSPRLLAEAQLDPTRKQRVEQAIAQSTNQLAAKPVPAPAQVEQQSPKPKATQQVQKGSSSTSILGRLNRGKERAPKPAASDRMQDYAF